MCKRFKVLCTALAPSHAQECDGIVKTKIELACNLNFPCERDLKISWTIFKTYTWAIMMSPTNYSNYNKFQNYIKILANL